MFLIDQAGSIPSSDHFQAILVQDQIYYNPKLQQQQMLQILSDHEDWHDVAELFFSSPATSDNKSIATEKSSKQCDLSKRTEILAAALADAKWMDGGPCSLKDRRNDLRLF